jgi:hypothetical protein
MTAEATNQHDREPAAYRQQSPANLPFGEWIDSVFDHPVDESKWYWSDATSEIAPTLAIEHLTRLFKTGDPVLSRFSSSQIGQGLWYLVCGACSNYMWPLVQEGLPWEARRDGIRAIVPLFEQVFAARCSDHLSHLDEPDADPLNEVCYMWWDLFPTWGDPNDTSCVARDRETLQVMARLLSLDSAACQESALHGLGHWYPQYPEFVERSVREFLQENGGIRKEIRLYALNACQGNVL